MQSGACLRVGVSKKVQLQVDMSCAQTEESRTKYCTMHKNKHKHLKRERGDMYGTRWCDW
jgi:hypothetical protein